MKDLAIWIDDSNNRVTLCFAEAGVGYTFYYRPLSYLPRLAHFLAGMEFSHNYKFRPFLGGNFGIVVEKAE